MNFQFFIFLRPLWTRVIRQILVNASFCHFKLNISRNRIESNRIFLSEKAWRNNQTRTRLAEPGLSEKETTIRKSRRRVLTRQEDAKEEDSKRRGGRWSSFLFIIPGSFGVVPFRQRAGNFSLLLATSRYVRYYVREKPARDRERRTEKERKGLALERRGLPADIKDIPCWQTNATVSLLQLRQSHLLISLSDNPLSPATYVLILDPTFSNGNPYNKSFHRVLPSSLSRQRERVCRFRPRFYATHVCYD